MILMKVSDVFALFTVNEDLVFFKRMSSHRLFLHKKGMQGLNF